VSDVGLTSFLIVVAILQLSFGITFSEGVHISACPTTHFVSLGSANSSIGTENFIDFGIKLTNEFSVATSQVVFSSTANFTFLFGANVAAPTVILDNSSRAL